MFLILTFWLCGCTNTSKELVGLSYSDVNNQLKLSIITEWNTYEVEDPITISIKNTTNETIVFPYDYGTKIFIFSEGDWEEIDEKEMLSEKELIPITPGSTHHLSLFGDFPIDRGEILTRIYVIGQMENSGRQVAGYIELTLH
jgi:hypothetical protein